jgi:D-alanine-D-alanine ligase
MRVAVLHNRRPEPIPPDLPEDEFEEYDSAETVDAIVHALARMGIQAEPVIADRDLPARLADGYDFVFNIAEGTGRRVREAVPAAICELLALPYTGSDPLTLAATLDKAIARRIVSPDVPVARGTLCAEEFSALRFPVIVKPNDEGSSKGIRWNSFCADVDSARRQAHWLEDTYGCPVLVEEWLPGAEVTVALAGNGPRARVLAMMEIGFAAPSPQPFLYSLEVKRAYREKVRYRVPPSLPGSTLNLLEAHARDAYRLLGCRDFARIDFRLDSEGRPRFLECNPLPGLNPESSDFVIATRAILTYDQLIGNILRDAALRHGISL